MPQRSKILVPESFNLPRIPENIRDDSARAFLTKLLESLDILITEYSAVINIKMFVKYGDTMEGSLDFGSSGRFRIPVYNGDPSAPANGEIWYDSNLNVFRRRRNGVSETW